MNDDWEKLFDKVLEEAFSNHGESYEVYDPKAMGEDIKSFIRTQISLAEKRGAEKAVEFIENEVKKDPPYIYKRNAQPLLKLLEQAKSL